MIETKELVLRSGTVDDWRDLYANLWSRAEAFAYLFSKPCADEAAAQRKTAAYANMHRQVKTEFFVVEKQSGRVIGVAGIKELAPGQWTVTDIAIGPDDQGRGYGRQALTALVDLAFREYHAKSLAYACFVENEVSRHLAERCGFTYTHTQEAELKKSGEPVLLAHYMLLAR